MPRGGAVDKTPSEYWIDFTLKNACVTFFDDHFSRFRSAYVVNSPPVEAMVHGFTEYTEGYQRLTTVRPPRRGESVSPATCQRGAPLAIAVPFSCNNIYHQTFHAVPAWEMWKRHAPYDDSTGGTRAVDFLPLVYPSAAIGKKMSTDPRRWHAWEFSIRPFTRRSTAEIAKRTDELINSRCTCFDTIHANAPAFNPIARTAAPRLRAFRRAALRMLPGVSVPRVRDVPADVTDLLWIVRQHALRNIQNDAQLRAAFSRDAALARRLKRVTLEELSLSEQMALLASSCGLLAVHGQAMSWVLFLPSGQRRTAAVEIFPKGLVNHIYKELSTTLGVRYEDVQAKAASGCVTKGAKIAEQLKCNVSVDVDAVVAAASRSAAWTAGSVGVVSGI